MKNYPKWIGSSADPDKIALTWKGVAIGLVPLFLFIGTQFGYDISQDQLVMLINQAFVVVSSAIVLTGLIRKMYFRLK